MKAQMNIWRAGLVLGVLVGGWHLCWSLLVALRWAQPVIDFVFWMHFIKTIYVIEAFEVDRAMILISVTTGVGFVIGSVFALIWNALHKA
jgi:hypothetical protein